MAKTAEGSRPATKGKGAALSPEEGQNTPTTPNSRDGAKVPSWSAVQDHILSKVRDNVGAASKADSSLTLHHAPQVLHTLECPGTITAMTHFPITTGDMFTCQTSTGTREHHTLAWKLNPTSPGNNSADVLKSYRFPCPVRITQMIFIPKCRVYVGYSPTKVLRVFVDPETGCQEVFTIPCVSVLTCMAYNRETEEIIAGGKGFVETWKLTGKEYMTTLQKGKKLELNISKDSEVTELKVDSKNSQVFVVSEKGMTVINYRTSKQTHIMVNRHSGKLTRCCIYHDGEYLVTGSTDGTIKIWNSVVYTQVHEFPGHGGPVTALQGHRRDPLLFSASTDGSLYVWRLDSFQKYMSLDIGSKVMSMKLLSDQTLFCQTETEISIYTLNQFHRLFINVEAPVCKLQRALCQGGHPNRILVSTEDGFVQMISPVTGATITSMSPLPNKAVLQNFLYNSKERSLYTILGDGEVVVLNATRNPLRASEILEPPLANKKVQALAMMKVKTGSGNREAEDTLIFMGMKNGQISILESYGMIMEKQVDAHQGEVTCLASSTEIDSTMTDVLPTSRFLVSGGMDNVVNIWNLEYTWDEEEENYNVELVVVQKIDCSGTPSHIAMFENVICVALGAYGLTKMFRLGGLRSDLVNQGGFAIAVALTHNSVYDHSDEVMSLDMCPMIGMFLTCSNDGFVKIWDSDNQPVREMNFGRPIHGACFANNRGDILVGLHNRIIMVPMTSYLPLDQLERMAQKMFKDDLAEKPLPYKPNKNRRKHWFDRKSLPKFSTDLQKRISEKVQMHSEIFSEMLESDTSVLERIDTDLSLLTEVSAQEDLESEAEVFNAPKELEVRPPPSVAAKEKRPTEMNRARRRTRGSISLRKRSLIQELKEEEEEDLPPRARKLSIANARKRSSLASIGLTARVIKDLELAAKRKRLSIVNTMSTVLVVESPVDEKKKREEDERALAHKKELEAKEAKDIKKLSQWEQFLMKRKPIIALDGYIPNSVVRAAIGFVKPKSPEPEWRLKPVPKVNPKHLPEGWKIKPEEDSPTLRRESSVLGKDADIKSVMSMKRESTLQNIKQQQSIKDASMYIGTIYCLLPDGTEPESVPNFAWNTSKEEVVDLTGPIKVKTVTPVPKQTTVITAVPQKPQPLRKDTSLTPQNAGHKSTRKIAQKNVSIDLSANMDMRIASRPKPMMELPTPKREKSLSFRLPTAGTSNAALIEEPAEEEKQQAEVGPGSKEDHPRGVSGTSQSQGDDRSRKSSFQDMREREASLDRGQPHAQGRKSGHLRTPGKVGGYKRELTEQEVTLLQRIVQEEWFPKGIAPAFEPVMDTLLAFVEKGEVTHYNKVCDYIVAVAKEIGIPQRYMNKCGDKLTKQTSHVAALIRKKSLWTLRQLGINRKDLLSAILPGLSDAKEDIREEAIAALNEMMGDQAQEGLANLMSSLGISKSLNSKEDRQAALKAVSERLVSDKKSQGPGAGESKERIQMWVSSLSANDPTSTYDNKTAEAHKMSSRWDAMTPGASRGSIATLSMSDFDTETPSDRDDFLRSKSGRRLKSRHKSSLSRKSTGKLGEEDSEDQPDGLRVPGRVEQGTGMSPGLNKEGKKEGGRAEGRRGPQGSMRAEDEYLFKRYEHYGSEYSEEEDIYADRSQFVAIDHDLTPNMFRSDTGDSWLSDDFLPSLNRPEQSSRRPKGASVQKLYSRQEQVAHTGTDADGLRSYTDGLRSNADGLRSNADGLGSNADGIGSNTDGPRSRRRWQQSHHLKPDEYDSDIHSVSQYDTDAEGGTQRTLDGGGTDIASMADSGIVPDVSETSSNMPSLYKQGQPGLSPISSTSQMGVRDGDKPKKKGESDWREFFEMSSTVHRKRAEQAKKKEKEKEAAGKGGKVIFSTNLPPITYINNEQPTTAGEAGLRCLHSIRVAEKEKADSEKTKIDSVPARLSIHTQDQSAGETNYGLLQMTWTTNVPALPIMPETRGEQLIPKDIMQPWDQGSLPRLMQPGLWAKHNAESLIDELQKKLPDLKTDQCQGFQWKRPLPPAKVTSRDPVAERPDRHQCDHMRLAKKKMHHFTSITRYMANIALAEDLMQFGKPCKKPTTAQS